LGCTLPFEWKKVKIPDQTPFSVIFTWGEIMMRYLVGGTLGIVALSVPVAYASETKDAWDKKWSFTVAPYVWGTAVQGTVATLPPLPPVKVDASFGDIIKQANLGFVGAFELRKGKVGFITDIVWLKLSAESSALPSPFTHTLNLESESFMGTALGAYRAIKRERGWLDLVVGVRGWYVDTSLDVGPGILLPGRTISHTEGWVDVIGGARARINLGQRFYATAWTLGGGGSSQSVVDLTGTIGYAFTDNISATAGYRYIKVDYSKSGFVWNVEYQGPILGGMFKF
jgi:hypothetical protein